MLRAAVMFAVLSIQTTPSPLAGEWSVNMAKSKPHPSFTFKSVTLRFTVADDTVTVASKLLTAAGDELNNAETFSTDGRERAGTITAGVTVAGRWVKPRSFETTAKKDGAALGTITYEVSADGKTLTARSSGILEQILVFDRK
jgi:hypothetical protein